MNIEESKISGSSYFLLGITCICWGWADNLAKHGLVYFSTYEVGVMRIFISSLLFTPISLLKIKQFRLEKIYLYAIISLCGTVLPAFLYAKSQSKLDAWITTVVSAIGPIFALFLSKTFLKKNLRKREIFGVILGLLGALVFTLGLLKSVKSDSWYAIFPVMATFSYAAGSIILSIYLKNEDIIAVSSFGMSFYFLPSILLLFFNTSVGIKLQTVEGSYKGLLYITLVSFCGTAIGFLCYNILTGKVSPIFASIAKLTAPIISIVISTFSGENISFTQFIGAGIILMSVYFIIFQKKKVATPLPNKI